MNTQADHKDGKHRSWSISQGDLEWPIDPSQSFPLPVAPFQPPPETPA